MQHRARFRWLLLLFLVGFWTVPYLARPAPAAADPDITTDVISAGGGKSQSSSYVITDTFGQGPIGPVATGTTISFQDGFWVTLGAEAAPADTQPPSPVVLDALPLDEEVLLEWTNPSDTDFWGTLIRYSTTDFPDTVTDGIPVEYGPDGKFYGDPGSDGQFSHTGRANDTTYYYTAWAFDNSGNYARGVRDSATPFDGLPPGRALFDTPEAGDGYVKLRWTNPGDADFEHALLIYNTTDYPTGPEDGAPVNGTDGKFFKAPATVDSFVHTGLTNGTMYYYGVYAGDEVPNYAVGSIVSALPTDQVAPDPVSGFEAIALSESSIKLRWTNPGDADFEGTLVRYSTTAYPTSIDDGSAVENGNEGKFTETAPADPDSFNHTDLTSGTTYYYSIFA